MPLLSRSYGRSPTEANTPFRMVTLSALTDDEGDLIGCISLYRYLATSFTHPERRVEKPGTLMAWWSLGHGARTGKEWVRSGGGHEGLVRYDRDAQGFELIHATERRSLARP